MTDKNALVQYCCSNYIYRWIKINFNLFKIIENIILGVVFCVFEVRELCEKF